MLPVYGQNQKPKVSVLFMKGIIIGINMIVLFMKKNCHILDHFHVVHENEDIY